MVKLTSWYACMDIYSYMQNSSDVMSVMCANQKFNIIKETTNGSLINVMENYHICCLHIYMKYDYNRKY